MPGTGAACLSRRFLVYCSQSRTAKAGRRMEQLRTVDTSHGQITYTLVRKQVKNLNLRIDGQGRIFLSVPVGCSPQRADQLIRERGEWLRRHLEGKGVPGRELPPLPEQEPQETAQTPDAVQAEPEAALPEDGGASQ